MDADRLQNIEKIYHAVLEIPKSERDSFFIRHCGQDAELRRAVETLLAGGAAQNSSAVSFVGTEINQYKIISLLGRGGMGAVYLAFDSRLERRVAVKLLSGEFAKNLNRLGRFFQEAKAASALNHPNILTVHEIGEVESLHYIVTEYIHGKTLKQFLETEKPTLRETLEIAVQIASALCAAHEAGIIHRDIKPDNIMVRGDGIVKILDFGLAKLSGSPDGEEFSHEAETVMKDMTAPGMIIGTPQYMSPEQARGQHIDERTDIFSFGIVLYEMIAGQPPFIGDSDLDTIGAILRDEPAPINRFAPHAGEELPLLIAGALHKNREQRHPHIRLMHDRLKEIRDATDPKTPIIHRTDQPPLSRKTRLTTGGIVTERRFSLIHALGFALFAAVSFVLISWLISKPAAPSEQKLKTEEVVNWTSSPGEIYSRGSFSPDGKMIAFSSTKIGTKNIWIKQTNAGEAIQITKDEFKNEQPIWSPGGEELAYYSTRGNVSGFWRIPTLGGSAKLITTIEDGGSRLLFWAADDRIYYESKNEIFIVDAASGQKRQMTDLTARGIAAESLTVSSDGKKIAYTTVEGTDYLLWMNDAAADHPQKLLTSPTEIKNPAWHPDNRRLIYSGLLNDVFQVFAVDAANPVPQRLSFSEQDNLVLNISPDGSKILYGSTKEESDL